MTTRVERLELLKNDVNLYREGEFHHKMCALNSIICVKNHCHKCEYNACVTCCTAYHISHIGVA